MTWGRVKEYRQLLTFLSQILPSEALKPHKNILKKATDSMCFVIRRWWGFLAQTSLILDSQNLLKPYFTNYLDMLIIWGRDTIDANRMEHTEEKAPLGGCWALLPVQPESQDVNVAQVISSHLIDFFFFIINSYSATSTLKGGGQSMSSSHLKGKAH